MAAARWPAIAAAGGLLAVVCWLSAAGQVAESQLRRLASVRLEAHAVAPQRLHRPLWNGSVLPDNLNDQQLVTVRNPSYGVHIFALGKNGSLYHKYQTGPMITKDPQPHVPMTEWLVLTPNASLVIGNAPAAALNADGRIELFFGYAPGSLDLYQMYQTDAKNPLAWSKPRAPWCLVPSAPECDNCENRPDCYSNYWTTSYVWTTNQQELWFDPADQKLKLSWRTFDGHVYQLTQNSPSESKQWNFSSIFYYDTIFY